MNLLPLSAKQLRKLFEKKVAVYQSRHSPYRFYLVDFKTDYQFKTHKYEDGKLKGSSCGKYKLFDLGLTGSKMSIQYEHINNSDHIDSPMHPENHLYKKLGNYTMGQFYCSEEKSDNKNVFDVLYKCELSNYTFEILHFYNRDLFDHRSM